MKKTISVLLAAVLMLSLLAGCGQKKNETEGDGTSDTPGTTDAEATYTYKGTYSGVSTWSPTDWEISSEYDMLG
ncbi:MAG: hypothetical protein ACI3VB_07995, partial [Oscillospiraceae bacterium]